MVNCSWFGLVVWIPRIPLWKGWLLRDIPRIPNHQLTISWKKFLNKRTLFQSPRPLWKRRKRPELLNPSISEAGIETFLQVFLCQTKTIRTQTCPVYDQWIHNRLVAPVQMHCLQLMTMLPEDILSEKFPDLFIWMQIWHSWSLTAKAPEKLPFQQERIVFQPSFFRGELLNFGDFIDWHLRATLTAFESGGNHRLWTWLPKNWATRMDFLLVNNLRLKILI